MITGLGSDRADFNKAETEILEQELASNKVIGWLRNTDRKSWALCIPYEVDGEDRAMYPDFLMIRSEGGNLLVDIVDPHTISLADAPAKAAGLARFAAQHADKFGRIQLVMIDGKVQKRLELTDETVRNKVRGLKLPEQMRQLFTSP